MKHEQITEQAIKELVDTFYGKVRADEELAPIFNRAIGEDWSEWKTHLQTMYAFWSSVMLTSGRYHGNPMGKHLALPPFEPALFNRWLELFAETADEIHVAEVAEEYKFRSRRIAENLKQGLAFYRMQA